MEKSEEYIRKWFDNYPKYISYAESLDPKEGAPPPSLFYSLGIESGRLKEFSKETLEFLENEESYSELVNAIRAYTQFQDVFSLSLGNNDDATERVMFNRNYCYYESLIYLRESVASWLDGNVLASLALLRPFFELSLLHVYWYLRCEGEGYAPYYKWLDGEKEKPPFKQQLDFVFENLPSIGFVDNKRASQVKDFLFLSWKKASTYNHTPKIDESIVSISHSSRALSLEGMFLYIANASMLMRHIIYLYTLSFPMALFPVDRVRKWGYGGPAGLFFDYQNFALLNDYLGVDNVEKMQAELKDVEGVKALTDWYSGLPDLTQEQIDDSWVDFLGTISSESVSRLGKLKDNIQRMTSFKSNFRILHWFMNYHFEEKPLPDISDEKFERILKNMKSW